MAAHDAKNSTERATLGIDVPNQPRSFRLNDQELTLLGRLQRRLAGRSQRDILVMALIHLWVTLQRDERVHLVLDDETEERSNGDSTRTR